jgi:hypothetical protein
MAVTRHSLVLLAPILLSCGSEGELLGVIVRDAGVMVVDDGPPNDGAMDGDVTNDGPTVDGPTDGGVVDDGAILTDSGTTPESGLDAEAGVLQPTPFGPPSIVTAIADPNADSEDPSMTGDSLELYFMSTRSGNPDIWLSARPSASAPWGTPTAVKELNTSVDEGAPGVSLDGLTLWFCRSAMPNRPEIWLSTRTARGQAWGPPAAVSELDTAGRQLEPAVDESSLLMFFASDRLGAGWELFSSSRPDVRSIWGTPRSIGELNTSSGANDWDPFTGAGGLQIWFASTRSGGGDLYWSQRASIADQFAPPVPLAELNTSSTEGDPALSPDFRHILFASNRSGRFEIYEAWR